MGKTKVEDICKVIHEWVEKHRRNVIFHGVLKAFDEEEELIEGAEFVYGNKKIVLTSMKEQLRKVKQEKKKFINW